MKRRPREQCGISVFFTLLPAAGIDAPAVANNEHNRASHTRGNFADDYEDRQAGSFLDASLRGGDLDMPETRASRRSEVGDYSV